MFSLSGYLESRFPDAAHSGAELRILCPKCEHPNRKAFINTDNGRSICFHCGWKTGGARSLVRSVENIEDDKALDAWIERHRAEFGNGYMSSGSYVRLKRVMKVELPPQVEPIEHDDAFCAYLEKRGFGYLTALLFDMKKCESGKYANRIVVPVLEDGALCYYFDRSIVPDEERKTLGVGSSFSQWPVKKSHVVFNLDMARSYVKNGGKRIYIAEGIFSALSLGTENVVATLGKGFSSEQVKKILSTNAKEYVICFDPDATESAYQMAKKMTDTYSAVDADVYVREYKDGDPNDYLLRGHPSPGEVLYSPRTQILRAFSTKKHLSIR